MMESTTTFEEILEWIYQIYHPDKTLLNLLVPEFWTILPSKIEEQQMLDSVADELEILKTLFKRVENYLTMNKEVLSGKQLPDVMRLLERVMGSGYKTLFSLDLMSVLKTYLPLFKEDLEAIPDLCSLQASTTDMSTSSMTVLTQEESADVNGKRKRSNKKVLSLDDDLTDSEDEEYENSLYPTGFVSCYTSVLKDDIKKHRILTEKYKPLVFQLKIWQSKDLRGHDGRTVNWQEKKNKIWKEIQMTYEPFSKQAKCIQGLEDAVMKYFVEQKEKGKKIKRSFPNYNSYWRNTQ
uniref:Uncharacterized protein n=1 Tax=Parvoviridae sp. TaxID=1940570 RepID=A0A893A7M4_9VIRU|nr:MAG: hypothetical protein 2 [Parvoviridae sp.]